MALALVLAALGSIAPGVPLAATPSIAAGFDRTCAVNRAGGATCWGYDAGGAIGDNPVTQSLMPVLVVGLSSGVSGIATAAGAGHVCAIAASGQALCWGLNAAGELGNGTLAPSSVPAPVSGLTSGVTSIAMGDIFTCALTSTGAVWCWGDNQRGQLGNGTTSSSLVPVPVTGLSSGIRAIAASGRHACAITAAGGVVCWGQNDAGELGNNSNIDSSSPAPVSGLSSGVVAIAAGWEHTCAVTNVGGVWCWGRGDLGQLGTGTRSSSAIPVQVAGLASGMSKIAIGAGHSCAASSAGATSCWGTNGSGQLGDGTTTDRLAPVSVAGLSANVRAMALGSLQSCALTTDGVVRCWGDNGSGEFGNGTQASSLTPTPATGLTAPASAIAVASGDSPGSASVCAVTAAGAAYCWGSNDFFQLGNGQSLGVPSPSPVVGLSSGMAAISTGAAHTCALSQAGTVYCWGSNGKGQLGTGAISSVVALPAPVATISSILSIAAGGLHTCALTAVGGVLCWGDDFYGQVGDGSTDTGHRPMPLTVVGLSSGVAQVSAGLGFTCARTTSGSVDCWGENNRGQLGNGVTSVNDGRTSLPQQVTGMSGATAISAGQYHACAIVSGAVQCWGDNSSGQLGSGNAPYSAVPVAVSGLPAGVTAISAGIAHTCALISTGAVYCWGGNFLGQLANGTAVNSSTPVLISSLPPGVIAIAAGWYHTCALTGVGDVFCWGNNSTGGLGDSTFSNRARPVTVAHEGGTGSLATNDWFLDLDPGVPKTIPPDKVPTFLANASGNAATAVVDVKANVQFRAQDAGNPIYVFGYVPASLLNGGVAGKDGASCVFAQLSPAGQLQQVSASALQRLAGNVITTQGQAITVINGVPATNVAGSTFCVGTAPTSGESVSSRNSRCVATVPPLTSTGPVCLPPDANTPAALSGLWWNAAESGWGIHFTQRAANVFAAWYTYDTSGNPKWYVSTCAMNGGATGTTGTCSGAIYEVSGPAFFGAAFNPQLVNAVQNGSLQVTFQNADSASLTYSSVAGQTRTVAITRQPLASGATPGVNYTDIWWGGASQSGWGMAITQQANTAFLAWYVYDSSGKPVWYVATCALSGTTCAGDLLRTTGPAFGPAFNSSQVQAFTAGTVSVTFTDGDNATLNYTAGGVTGSKTITRQLF